MKKILLGIVALILVFSAGSMIFAKSFYDREFPRYERKEYSGYLSFKDLSANDYAEVTFPSGKNALRGYIFGRENQKGLVVVAHGVGQGADRYLPEVFYFVNKGWRVFAFDGTGSHASEGKGTIGLPQSMLDLDAALTYIESDSTLNSLPVMLFGHSWGGFSTAAILNDDHNISAVASISGFNTPDELLLEQSKVLLGAAAYLEYPFLRAYQSMLFGKASQLSAVDGINKTGIPVMVVHGDQDESIAYNGASIIAHRSEITNPNVVFKTISAENRNGHMSLFSSDLALAFINEKNAEYQALNDQYQGNIPDDLRAEFYANLDKSKTSELDADLMDGINDLFEHSLLND